MRDSVPSASYSSVCNVLRQWNIPLIPSYRVYLLYDIYIINIIYRIVGVFRERKLSRISRFGGDSRNFFSAKMRHRASGRGALGYRKFAFFRENLF